MEPHIYYVGAPGLALQCDSRREYYDELGIGNPAACVGSDGLVAHIGLSNPVEHYRPPGDRTAAARSRSASSSVPDDLKAAA
eukprot:499349-Hanusia_phi.AAC.1